MAEVFDHDSGRSSPTACLTLVLVKEMVKNKDGADFDDVIQYVTGAMSVLQQNYNETELVNSMRMIQSYIKKENVNVLKFLESSEILERVITILKHLPDSIEIQQAGFTLLLHICENCPELLLALSTNGFHTFLLEQLKHHKTYKELQQYGIRILANLLSLEKFRDQLLLDKQEEEVAHVICVAVQSFPEVRDIQIAASRAIDFFLTDNDEDTELRTYFVDHVCDSLVDALHTETDTSTQIRILSCLCGTDDKQKMSLVQRDVHITLMEICSKHPTNKSLISEATTLLSLLTTDDTVKSIMSTNSFIQNSLFGIMDTLRLSEKVQRAGLKMMEILMPSILENKAKADEVSHTVVKFIYNAMFTHIEYNFVQIKPENLLKFWKQGNSSMSFYRTQVAGCRTLSVLLENRPEAHKWIGEHSEERQYPVHTLCFGALFSFGKDVEIFVSVCEAIFWIAADNERLCTALMNRNVHVPIIDGLSRHRKKPKAIENGCRALRGLCIFLYNHKETLVKYDAFSVLVRLQERYKSDVIVEIEVISAIACLADVDVVRYQCFVENIPQKVIQCMYEFADDMTIQEIGLETFAVLAGAEGGPDILLNAGALDVVLETMGGSPDNVLIIKKGLIVIQLLASPPVVQKEETRATIVTILKSALTNFTDVKGVQSEACVALQLLAEVDANMSRAFVDADCHECLFKILEDDNATGIHELSSECLFVLSQEQNLKSVMLLSACRSGILPATECLIELGADVNIGEDENTPLFLAVAGLHEHLVSLLLKQDIQDLRTPLVQSLKQKSHTISGLILQYLGFDRDGGVICWNGLELDSLEEKWILTTLANQLSFAQDTERGRSYIEKIKSSEQRRTTRKQGKLAYSKSDSQLKHPQVRLRHKIVFETKAREEVVNEQGPPAVPMTSMVISNRNPFTETMLYQRLNRSVSTDDNRFDGSVRSSRHPKLPTIISGVPTEDQDIPVFEASQTEDEEWREFTLSGANPAYSSNDPRVQTSPTTRKKSFEKGQWKRKHRTSRGSASSEETPSPRLGGRKMSEPVLSGLDRVTLPRRSSEEHLYESTLEFRTLLYLDISENFVQNITSLVSQNLTECLAKLHTLDLRSNKLSQLPEDLWKNLPLLHLMDASYNELEEFPDTLLQCKRLAQLRLGVNKIKVVTLRHFNTSLKSLDLTRNQIKELPEGIGNYLHNVQDLCLSHNDLIALPENSIGLQMLQTLDLSYNQIDCVPDEFLLTCTKLETLDLSYNLLTRLPDEKNAEKLINLAKLKVRHNHLVEKEPFYIPRFILELPSLRSIDISENQLAGFPSLSIWKTQTMKDFIASKNNITKLNLENPKPWSKLEKLHVSHNKLKLLPKEIGQFTSLTSLDFSHNKDITSLPDELGRCSKIYEMPIDGLDLDMSRVITARRVKDIISYLHNRLKKAQRYYRMKLMVVGYGGRGKTTLLKTLMKEKVKKKENRPTVGVVVKDWVYTMFDRRVSDDGIRLFNARKVHVTLNTWDFAGQEDFYSTHNCYLSNRAVYLVVFDLRKGVGECENLKSWLGSIRSRAPGCPVFIVGTHLDNLDEGNKEKRITQVTDMLREINIKPGFPDINHVFLVDASCENEDMDDLRKAIKKVVDTFQIRGQRVMGEKIPASYVQLADLLSERAKSDECKYPVLQYRELLELVHDKKLDLDESELQQAVKFLHESGVLLHYDDASLRLKDYYFIDPGWLCQMMAQIITVRQINPFINTDGILKKRDIDILFKEKSKSTRFPQYLIPQYIKLLEKFEIALPHSETELLIPSKLPKAKPVIHPPGLLKICRIYRMPHVPIGLWFRLIARMISMTMHIGFQSIMKLSKPQKTVCWRKGVYIYWSETEYFLLDSSTDEVEQTDSIHITVPSFHQGSRLLGQIVDSLDNLIDEWYPGLTCIDPMMGQEVLEILAPCSHCKSSPTMFTIQNLRVVASKQDSVYCPTHDGDVDITDIAPDLVLGDLEEELKLNTSQFVLEESSDKQLGDGSFGDVYRAIYKNKEVAAKVFKEVADVHALTMLRQEATIIRCLKHPSVVCMVAVGIRPPVILLELAPYGTLKTLAKRTYKRALYHRIALQVAEGLMYLHSIMIIFRDMKPENVLVFSTSLDATINAKISDYGIARVTTLQGQMSQEGTPAYRAPEVIRKENYSFKADIFSYGLTMYVMMTNKHPFDYMDSRGEIDRAIAEGVTMPQPDSDRVSPVIWPDMTTITMSCLCYEPADRPDAEQVWEALRRPEVLCLKRHIPVSRSTTVECLCVEEIDFGGMNDLRLWIASGDSETFQLSYRYVSDLTSETKGQLFKYGRVLCMEPLDDHRLALGTQAGKVWIYDTSNCTLLNSSANLKAPVLSMKHYKNEAKGKVLLAGLANGKLAIFQVQELLQDNDADPVCLYPGKEQEPVLCMTKLRQRIFLSCGTRIIALNISRIIEWDKEIETAETKDASTPAINTLAVIKGHIIFSRKSSSCVEIWDSASQRVEKVIAVDETFDIPKTEARVTALSVDNTSIWIGTHGGYLGVLDIITFSVVALTHRHMRAVRSIVHVNDKGSSRNKVVFSGGLGFRDVSNFAVQKQDMWRILKNIGGILWPAALPYAITVTVDDLVDEW
ncbi:leucine-rich repeat serine/threonine-protein kinase 2-like [Ruditapes philippinarum]|uniref:leucine-rich repeat serine/threonine-protein kinase 2-like n=1 Tax=Ruditapes philippinarum TaxID=129788 RepID=UPI00295BBF4D|nr:leucine-rich repeat serine/threonine-protein kinase 2-like [Ruditapes philippinarum]